MLHMIHTLHLLINMNYNTVFQNIQQLHRSTYMWPRFLAKTVGNQVVFSFSRVSVIGPNLGMQIMHPIHTHSRIFVCEKLILLHISNMRIANVDILANKSEYFISSRQKSTCAVFIDKKRPDRTCVHGIQFRECLKSNIRIHESLQDAHSLLVLHPGSG